MTAWCRLQELTKTLVPWVDLPTYRYLDPYVAWADATCYLGTTAPPLTTELPLLVKASISSKPVDSRAKSLAKSATFKASGASSLYERSSPGQSKRTVYFTGVVQLDSVRLLVPGYEFEQVDCGQLTRWTIDFAAVLALPRVSTNDPRVMDVKFAVGSPLQGTPVIAVIDDGCPFAHMAYRRGAARRTRVIHLWDQGSEDRATRWEAQAPQGFGYGREIAGPELDKLMQDHVIREEVDEDGCYRTLGLHSLREARFTHGAHVLGLAAGAPDPLAYGTSIAADRARDADIVFVQLPRETMRDTSGGALARHVLDALRYIDLRTSKEVSGELVRRPLVVNLSVGAAAGPHDGTSLLEQAIGDFIQHRPGCAVVVAAGNARARALHARLQLEPGSSHSLSWVVDADDGTDSFLEFWYPKVDDTGGPVEVSVRIVPPDSLGVSGSPWVPLGETSFVVGDSGVPFGGIVHAADSANGETAHVALCFVGPTVPAVDLDALIAGRVGHATPPRQTAPHGVWRVEVRRTQRGQAIVADAWIERDERAFGGTGRQSDFGPLPTFPTPNDATLSTLAHSRSAVVVGGYEFAPGDLLDRHSGEGPGRLGHAPIGPDLVAPSDESPTRSGLLSYGVHSGEWNRLSGTSVAAAVTSRRIYNDLYAQWGSIPDADSLKRALTVDEVRQPPEPESRVGRGRICPPGW